jgi:hypothetical protein
VALFEPVEGDAVGCLVTQDLVMHANHGYPDGQGQPIGHAQRKRGGESGDGRVFTKGVVHAPIAPIHLCAVLVGQVQAGP